MNLAQANQSQRVEQIGELLSASAAKLSTAAVSVPGMRSVPFRFEVNQLLKQQAELEQAYDRLKAQIRAGNVGQVPRPRWGYRYNVEQYNAGLSPPGACPIPPRGEGVREGTRQYYQPGRSPAQMEGFFIPILIGGSLLTALGTWAWKHHEQTAEVENRVKVYEDLVASGMDEEEAARLAFGGGSDVSAILSKVLLLSAVGIGVYIMLRVWK